MSAAVSAEPAPADPPRPVSETDITELPFAALRELAEAGDAAAPTYRPDWTACGEVHIRPRPA